MKKRIISILLVLLFVFSCTFTALSEAPMGTRSYYYQGECGENVYWSLDSDTCVLRITGNGYMYDYSEDAFNMAEWCDHAEYVRYIVIGDGVTGLGSYAFCGLYNLESVEMGDGVLGIGFGSFKGCTSLTELTLSSNLRYMNHYAFMNCTSLVSFTMPSKVYQIGSEAFSGCSSLSEITFLGDKPTSVGVSAFDGCSPDLHFYYTLAHVSTWAPNGETTWNGITGGIPIDVIPFSGECGADLCWVLHPLTGILRIYGTGNMYNYDLDSPAPWQEYTDMITRVLVENGAESIGDYAFANLIGVLTVGIPSSVGSIGEAPFYFDEALVSIDVTSTSEYFCTVEGAIYNFDMTELIAWPAGRQSARCLELVPWLEHIRGYAFTGSSEIEAIFIPDTMTTVEANAFYGMRYLTSLVFLGAKPASFGTQDFSYGVTEPCFYYTAANVNEWAPGGQTAWNGYAIAQYDAAAYYPSFIVDPGEDYVMGFETSGGTYLMVNYSTTAPTPYYFTFRTYNYGWTAPAAMTGAAVSGVSGNAADLMYCTWRFESADGGVIQSGYQSGFYLYARQSTSSPDLYPINDSSRSWYCDPVEGRLYTNVSASSTYLVYARYYALNGYDLMRVNSAVPENEAVRLYRRLPIPDVASLRCGDELFWQYDPVSEVLRIHGTGDMYDFDTGSNKAPWHDLAFNISYVEFEGTPLSIGAYAFADCGYISSVEIPASMISVDALAFVGCTRLTSFTVDPDNYYYSASDGVLFNKAGTVLVRYPSGKNIAAYTVPDGVTRIGDSAFNGSLKLHSVTLPQGVTQIGVRAFYGCSNLTYMYVYGQITQINSFAFMNCGSLRAFYCFNARPANVGQYAFRNCPAELCFFYTEAYADTWTVYGATTWNGYPIAQLGGEEWVPADTIVPGEEYLIGFEVNGTTYLMVNYNIFESNAYYCTNAAYWYLGYTAPALKDGTTVTGVYGCAGSLDYCTWIFDATYGGSIRSGYEADRYLSVSNPNWPDLYPGTSNYISWTYDASQGTLVTAVGSPSELRYASYFSGNENGLTVEHTMCVSSTAPEHRVQLYRRAGQQPQGLLGDVNGDGAVTFTDISVLYGFLLGKNVLPPELLANADFDGDGTVTFNDVGALYYYCLGSEKNS